MGGDEVQLYEFLRDNIGEKYILISTGVDNDVCPL
jgi:hypothetical protein